MNSIGFNTVGYTTNFRGLGGLFVVAANNKLRNDSNSSKKDDYYRGSNHGLTFSDSSSTPFTKTCYLDHGWVEEYDANDKLIHRYNRNPGYENEEF